MRNVRRIVVGESWRFVRNFKKKKKKEKRNRFFFDVLNEDQGENPSGPLSFTFSLGLKKKIKKEKKENDPVRGENPTAPTADWFLKKENEKKTRTWNPVRP